MAERQSSEARTLAMLLLSKLQRLWVSTQVSHRGRYSIERLVALNEYTRRTSRVRVFLVCIGTPLPMIAFVLSLECIPLGDPNHGWKANCGLWIRCAVVCGVVAYTMLVELTHLIEGVTVSFRQGLLVLGFVMVGNTALCMAVAAYVAFPIPFMSILMVPPLLAIVAGSLRVVFGDRGFRMMLSHPAQLGGFVLFILAQALTLAVYPVYQVLFDAALNTSYELPVMLLLPVVKMVMKNIVAESIDYMEDMMPEAIMFTVNYFDAIYVAMCMQRLSSTTTVAAIMVVDTFHTCLSLRGLYSSAADIKRRLKRAFGGTRTQLHLLDEGYSLCQDRHKFDRQEHSQIQLRSCLHHELSSAGRSLVAQLEKYALKPAVKAHRRCIRNTNVSRVHTMSIVPGWVSAKRLTARVYTAPAMNSIPVKAVQQDGVLRKPPAEVPPPPALALQRTLEILFTSECVVLTEYLESFIPILYASFICVMVRLPSAKYHGELEGITRDNVQTTVQSVFLYGLLECTSFLVLVVVIKRTLGMKALYHLAFVLETQMSLVQSKLVVWMLLTLTCRVTHYGFDFTFRFRWLNGDGLR